jgi:hypothetical protein
MRTLRNNWSIVLFLLLLTKAAFGACPAVVPPNVACVKWAASPGWSNGQAYAAGTVVTYKVWVLQTSGMPDRVVATTTGLDAMVHGLSGRRCFVLVTTVTPVPAGWEGTSGPSSSTCKTLVFPGPTDGSIEAPTDGSIEKPK